MKKKIKKKKSMRPIITDGDFSKVSNGLSGNRVFVSMAKTINMGNYESLRVEFGIGRTVLEGQPFNSTTEFCKDEAEQNLIEMIEVVKSKFR